MIAQTGKSIRHGGIGGIHDAAYISRSRRGKYNQENRGKAGITNRLLGLPIFAAIMFLVYYISMVTVGAFATDWANDGLFGDGWHLLGIGSPAYGDAVFRESWQRGRLRMNVTDV